MLQGHNFMYPRVVAIPPTQKVYISPRAEKRAAQNVPVPQGYSRPIGSPKVVI